MLGRVIILAVLGCIVSAHADTIVLRDGQKFTGTITSGDGIDTITREDGTEIIVPRVQVASVTRRTEIPPAETAQRDWTDASAQIASSDDLKAILALHASFLKRHPDSAEVAAARASLARYQELAVAGAVKVRDRWMTQAEFEAQQTKSAREAEPATREYQAGRLDAAISSANAALQNDPLNADAHTILGLAAYARENLPLAHQSFSNLLEIDRRSVLARNNLAVISFRMNAAGAGLRHYAQAIGLKPENRLLLDNIAEALEAYPDKRAADYTRLNDLFQKADTAMRAAMAQRNLYRFGSGWTNRDQLARFQAELRAIENEMNAVTRMYREHVANVDRLQAQMDDYDRRFDAALEPWPFPLEANEDDPNEWFRDFYRQKIDDLSPTLEAANVEVDEDKIDAAKLVDRLATVRDAQFKGVQVIMQPGQDTTPPAVVPIHAAAATARP